jgi:antitoxin component YwqK of YwqJK toxin-antitoxin module
MKRILFSLFWILFFSTFTNAQDSYNLPRWDSDLPFPKDTILSWYYKNGQLAGKMEYNKEGYIWNIEEYTQRGKPIYIGSFKNGNGTIERNHKKVKSVGPYTNGQPDGNWQIFQDKKGKKLLSEYFYRNGFIVSHTSYDSKGRKSIEIFYDEKNLHKTIWDKKQFPVKVKRYRKGKLVQEDVIEYKKNKRPKTTITHY